MKWLNALGWFVAYVLALTDVGMMCGGALFTSLEWEAWLFAIGGVGALLIAIASIIELEAATADVEQPMFWLRMLYFGARNWRRRRAWRWAWSLEAQGAQPMGPYR